MNIVVVYESMFGNTHLVASAIAQGLTPYGSVQLFSVNDPASRQAAEVADLLVVGGPTHVHGMSRPVTRAEAKTMTETSTEHVSGEPGLPGIGVREWIRDLEAVPALCAAFDTRVDVAWLLSGAASGHIGHALKDRGATSVLSTMSFTITKDTKLSEGEIERAHEWGDSVGREASRFVEVG